MTEEHEEQIFFLEKSGLTCAYLYNYRAISIFFYTILQSIDFPIRLYFLTLLYILWKHFLFLRRIFRYRLVRRDDTTVVLGNTLSAHSHHKIRQKSSQAGRPPGRVDYYCPQTYLIINTLFEKFLAVVAAPVRVM